MQDVSSCVIKTRDLITRSPEIKPNAMVLQNPVIRLRVPGSLTLINPGWKDNCSCKMCLMGEQEGFWFYSLLFFLEHFPSCWKIIFSVPSKVCPWRTCYLRRIDIALKIAYLLMSLQPVIDHVRVFTDTSNVHLENTAKKKQNAVSNIFSFPHNIFQPFTDKFKIWVAFQFFSLCFPNKV